MTYYVCFAKNYDAWPPVKDMLRVEADDPQAAIEQVLREGNGPTDKRLRCAMALTITGKLKSVANVFWLNFDGGLSRLNGWTYSSYPGPATLIDP